MATAVIDAFTETKTEPFDVSRRPLESCRSLCISHCEWGSGKIAARRMGKVDHVHSVRY